MRALATRTVWHIPLLRRLVDHARHRAVRRSQRRRLALAATGGVLAGAVAVGLMWASTMPTPAAQPVGPSSLAASATVSATRSAEAAVAPQPTPREARAEASRQGKRVSVAAAAGRSAPVLLVGDSLAVGISAYVDAGLADRVLTVDAEEGRGTATQVALLESYAASAPAVWIVSLGTNDNPEEFGAQAPRVLELAGPQRCVVWFDVWRIGTDEQINDVLQRLATQHDNLHLIPWHQTSALHPEWFSGSDVHPSTAGYAVRGQLAVDALSQGCGGR